MRILAPTRRHRVEVFQRSLIVLLLNTAQRTVVPQSLSFRIVAQGRIIVIDGSIEVFLLNTTQSAQLIAANNIGIAINSL